MIIIKTSQYLRTKKRLIKKHILSEDEIEKVLILFQKEPYNKNLHYKRMNCKKDKDRYSIRIPNTQYRVLMNVDSNKIYLICICNHDEYDRRNKNC